MVLQSIHARLLEPKTSAHSATTPCASSVASPLGICVSVACAYIRFSITRGTVENFFFVLNTHIAENMPTALRRACPSFCAPMSATGTEPRITNHQVTKLSKPPMTLVDEDSHHPTDLLPRKMRHWHSCVRRPEPHGSASNAPADALFNKPSGESAFDLKLDILMQNDSFSVGRK